MHEAKLGEAGPTSNHEQGTYAARASTASQ